MKVVVLAGDGVGPEVVEQAVLVLQAAIDGAGEALELSELMIGGRSIDAHGSPLTDDVLSACRAADAVLLGAVGGPEWDHLEGQMRCEAGLLRLRQGMGVFANLRPARVNPGLEERSTLRADVVRGVDMLIVRELTGGIYFGQPRVRMGSGPAETAIDTMVYSRAEVRRVAEVAFILARARRGHVTSVDKANVLTTSRLWRDVVDEVATAYPDVTLRHQLVDACAMNIVRDPRAYDVILTENLFGDILSDEAAMLCGSLGMVPSASVAGLGGVRGGLYEPVHGSAPDIAGQGRANPLGAIQSVGMMLGLSLGREDPARRVSEAVDQVVARGVLTPDLGGTATTREVGAAVLDALWARTAPDTSLVTR